MLWLLRSHRHLSKVAQQSRSFSFTPNPRLLRSPARQSPRIGHTKRPSPEHVSQTAETKFFSEQVNPPSARNQILFFTFGSLFVFGVAARETNNDTYYWTKRFSDSSVVWSFRSPTNGEMMRARHMELGKTLQSGVRRLQDSLSGWSETIRNTVTYTYAQVAQAYLDVSEGKRMCYNIAAINGAVWVAWQIPQLQKFMMRSFTHSPLSGLSYTMLTSTFSHHSIFHLLFNTIAMTGFGSSAAYYLSQRQEEDPNDLRESTGQWHFLAFFVSAGLFSSLVSHFVAARFTYPRLLMSLTRAAKSSSPASKSASTASHSAAMASVENISSVIKPSLGSSGAIYAAVTLTAMAFPESHVKLIFPPTPDIPIQYGVFGLMALDVLGVLRGWKLFDHYAHLGGACFGLWYYSYGPQVWESFREHTLGGLPRSLRE